MRRFARENGLSLFFAAIFLAASERMSSLRATATGLKEFAHKNHPTLGAVMGRIEERLEELGLRLPEPFAPAGKEFNFRLVKVHGGLAYIAGHGPFDGATPLVQGRLGDDLTVEQGYEAARLTALAILASLKQELESLDRVSAWIRAVGYVQAAPGFDKNPLVVNGFSDLIVELWGDAGRHARSAPGQGPSPSNVPILVDAIAAID